MFLNVVPFPYVKILVHFEIPHNVLPYRFFLLESFCCIESLNMTDVFFNKYVNISVSLSNYAKSKCSKQIGCRGGVVISVPRPD